MGPSTIIKYKREMILRNEKLGMQPSLHTYHNKLEVVPGIPSSVSKFHGEFENFRTTQYT